MSSNLSLSLSLSLFIYLSICNIHRSEQDSASPIIGNPLCWERLLGPDVKLTTLNSAFVNTERKSQPIQHQSFPFLYCLALIKSKPRLIIPGLQLTKEILTSYFLGNTNKNIDKSNGNY